MDSQDNSLSQLEQLEPRWMLSGSTLFTQLMDTAQLVNVGPIGSVSVDGDIPAEGPTQMYKFTAEAMGNFYIDMADDGSGIDSLLTLYNEAGRRVRLNDNASRYTLDSRIRMRVRTGQTYYVLPGAKNGTTGSYDLTLTSDPRDDHSNDFAGAKDIRMSRSGLGRMNGTIDYTTDADVMRLVVPKDGPLEIDVSAIGRNNNNLNPQLFIYDSAGNLLASNANSATNAHISMNGVAGETLYIKVTGDHTGRHSRYRLEVNSPTDDYGDDFASAAAMRMSRSGLARARGNIDYTGDVDMLQVVSVTTGPMEISLKGFGRGSNLNPHVYLYDSEGTLLNSAQGTQGVSFSADTVAGETYYIKVAGDYNGRFNRYNLTAKCPRDDHGNFFADASILQLSSRGTGRMRGSIDFTNDVDMLQMVATVSGMMQIDVSAPSRYGAVNPQVFVYDSEGNQLATHQGTQNASVSVLGVAGETYYIKIAGTYRGRGSRYTVSVNTQNDDYGDTFARAGNISLDEAGSATREARINFLGDVDMFRITSALTGDMTVDMISTGCCYLDPYLYIYDSEGAQITYNDDGGAGLNSRATFDVTAGDTYYIKAATYYNYSMGQYTLQIETVEEYTPDPTPPAPEPTPNPDPDPDPQPSGSIVTEIISSDGSSHLRILGTDSSDIITLSGSLGSLTLMTGGGSQLFTSSIASVIIYGFGGSDTIRMTNSVNVASYVYAGAGDDTVYENSCGQSIVEGGDGDDLLVSIGGSSDLISGGAGFDSFWVDSSDNVSDASTTEQNAKSVHTVAEFYQPYSTNPGSSQYVSLEIAEQNFTDPTATSSAARWDNFADSPLFVDGPEYNDIRQGAIGDCYFLACLSSLADTDPTIISQMITSLGDGTYAVRFHRSGEEVFLRIDADLPVYSSGSLTYAKASPDGEIWVPLVEKAYAHFRYDQDSYSSIHGGWMSTTYREITGGYTNTMWTGGSTSTLYNYFADHLAQGHAVTLGSYSGAPSPVVGSHAYQVKSVHTSGGQQYVTVYNPWGVDGRSWDSNYYDGLLTLTIQQVQTSYSAAIASLV
ncbi:MAG: C2 family cysteine protease [Planctomycetota bacterium]|jgi:hypothetical protein